MPTPHLYQFLTRGEFALVFAIAFLVSEEYADWPIARYASEGTEGSDHSWEELCLRAMRYLVLEHGMEFKGVAVRPNGSVSAAEIVEEGNTSYVLLMANGGLPDLPNAFRRAIEVAHEKVPSLDREPFHSALLKVEKDLAWVDANTNTQAVEETNKLRRAALREVGWELIPRDGKATVH